MKNHHLYFNEASQNDSESLQSEVQQTKMFQLSNHNQESKGFKQFQRSNFDAISNPNPQQLKVIQQIALLKLQIMLQNMSEILRNKTFNSYSYGFDFIKKYEKTHQPQKITFNSLSQSSSPLVQNDRDLFIAVTELLVKKVGDFCRKKQLKIIGQSFNQILLWDCQEQRTQRAISKDQSESIVQPFRGSYKFDHFSEKQSSEWQLGHSQGGIEHNEQTIRQNKMLKKKKSSMQSKRENFTNKMEKLFTEHQKFLDKLN